MEVKEKTQHLTGIREFIYQGLELGKLMFSYKDYFLD